MNENIKRKLNTVTTLSKTLAMLLFVALPFVGLYVGYVFAPGKVIERVVEREVEIPVEKVVYRDYDQRHYNIVTVNNWDKEYPVLAQGNDLFITRKLDLIGMEQYDLTTERIPSVYFTDDFYYDGGYLINSDVVINTKNPLGNFVLEGVDPDTFEIISDFLQRDSDTLFFNGRALAGADPDYYILSTYQQEGIEDVSLDAFPLVISGEYTYVVPGCSAPGAPLKRILIDELQDYVNNPCGLNN